MTGGPPPMLETHGLTRRFGDVVAVDHLTIRVEALRALMIAGGSSTFPRVVG